ncbi:hypothetical protein [Aeoliella mucimassa]|uniref:Uncharacterized protein n=1 Tax=Aeoliella mucimassa TaxID=2527972 RepID=A0A518AHD5_9BACT|nr:hypothetical protein [Aeoliella mucimassa]QDU54151.1 hypothetical protein Pan181_03310 [Aeoliella mucimassa]
MLQLAVFIYGIVVLFRGKFALGGGREVVGTRARILGVLCVCVLPFAFCIGLAIGLLALSGVIDMPDQMVMVAMDLGVVIGTIVLVYVLGNTFYKRQAQEELEAADPYSPQTSSSTRGPSYSVPDPNNPYASPTQD